jgi:hypothetical protein
MGESRAAAIVAALSPRLEWRANLAAAAEIIGGGTTGLGLGLGLQRAKAYRLRAGAALAASTFGRERVKVFHFWRAIMGDLQSVTLDVWAVRAMGQAVPKGWLDSTVTYDRLAAVYVAAALIVGESPRDLQAIVWVQVRGAAQ